MGVRIALVGNQNSGKTTLFNLLTGSKAKVGNFPGVTVEKREGKLNTSEDATLIDLPGTYSLVPLTAEERVTKDVLLSGEIDGIIDIIDSNSLERSMYLTFEIMSLSIPMAVALNMSDELKSNGGSLDEQTLSRRLGIPAVKISALTGDGVQKLVSELLEQIKNKKVPKEPGFSDNALGGLISEIANAVGVNFSVSNLLEALVADGKNLLPKSMSTLINIFEKSRGEKLADAIINDRYSTIESCCSGAYTPAGESKLRKRSKAIDKVATNKFLAVPLFILIMVMVFWLSFSVVGEALTGLSMKALEAVGAKIVAYLAGAGLSGELVLFVSDGIMTGIGSVFSFLPTIIILFLLLSILEDSGYMARVAYIMDKPFSSLGLSGRYIVPMLLGLGCSVPALMAARAVGSSSDKKVALLLVPFISCSAKLPVYMTFAGAFFCRQAFIAVSFLYFLGIALAVIYAKIIKRSKAASTESVFVMELPDYRFPSVRNVVSSISEKVKEFTKKAFSVIVVSSMVIWMLSRYNFSFEAVAGGEGSILAVIGKFVSPVFSPLGFGGWRESAAIVSGLFAKEAVLSTLCVLSGSELAKLTAILPLLMSKAAAMSFLTFIALYSPCFVAVSVLMREMGGIKKRLPH